ncbi:MAG: SAM-dependent methyltransferase [Chitinophagales bacterium]|nr:SAM-dependent methyltransferase [Chitinophagales bacterium]
MLSEELKEMVATIEFFIVENQRSARRFLRSIGYKKNFDQVTLVLMESDNKFFAGENMINHLKSGKDIGVISEAGCPGIADPGAAAVRWAHKNRTKVVPCIGPSSIFLALMASGLNGQHFSFHGYLPIPTFERKQKLKKLEEESVKKKQTQIFMETPYRNNALLQDVLETCMETILLCLASDITLPSEKIFTQTIKEWKNKIPDLKNKPSIFLIGTEM